MLFRSHRRIIPIPISTGQDKSSLIAYGAEGKLRQFTPEEMKEGNIQIFRRICGMSNVEDEPPHVMNEDAINEPSEQTSGSHGPTISDTTISTNEGQAIREEVRTIVREQMAASRQMLRASLGLPNEAPQLTPMDKPASSTSTIDLVLGSILSHDNTHPRSMFGSPVSIESTRVQEGNDGKPMHFSRLSQGTVAASQPTKFATMQWKPKNLHVSLGIPRRTFILGRPWCVTTSLLWGVVMPNKSRMR